MNLLAVDDDPIILEIYRNIFSMQKHRAGGPTDQVDIQTEAQSGLHQLLSPIVLDTVEQGEWAARMAAEKNYAVALLDMNMPGGWSGLRTAEEIIKHSPQTRIIFVSAHIDYSLDKLQRKLGANFAFLHKPIDENALIQLVMLLVNGYQRELRLVGAEAGTLQANQVKDELIQRLEESEKRFRDLAESASDWIWETDYEGRYTFVSEPVNNFLGYTGPEILGRTTWELMPEEERERTAKMLKSIMAKRGRLHELELTFQHKMGYEVVVVSNGLPIFHQGEWVGYRGVTRDISRRKLMETRLEQEVKERTEELYQSKEAIREALHLNSTIIDEAPTGIAVYDSTGRCIRANSAIGKIMGVSGDQLLAQNYHELSSWKESGLYDSAVEVVASKQTQQVDAHLDSIPGKSLDLNCQMVAIGKQKNHLMLLVADVTAVKQADKRLRHFDEELENQVNHQVEELRKKQSQPLNYQFRVLIIEDSATVRYVVEEGLVEAGFIVETAESAEVGYQKIEQALEQGCLYDGILLDWVLRKRA